MKITVIGGTFVDIKGYPYHKFNKGGRNVGRVLYVNGGVGRNMAEDVRALGHETTYVTLLDETGLSQGLFSEFTNLGINTSYIKRTSQAVGNWLVIFNDLGEVESAISMQPNLGPIEEVIETHGDRIFQESDGVIVEFDVSLGTLQKLIALSKKYQKPLYSAVANIGVLEDHFPLLKDITCFICNEQEADLLFHAHHAGEGVVVLQDSLMKSMALYDIPAMIVTLGERGAVFANRLTKESGYVPALKVPVVETAGCGDAFAAGAFSALISGKTYPEALSYGASLSAKVLQTTENVLKTLS